MTDDHKKDQKPADPKTVVAQQPPGQRHPQQTAQDPGSPNEPPGSDTTPWYNPSDRDKGLHDEERRKNYTPEQQQQRRDETTQGNKATNDEGEARSKKNKEEEDRKTKEEAQGKKPPSEEAEAKAKKAQEEEAERKKHK